MVKSVEGICRNGIVELVEPLPEVEGSRVIDLRDRNLDEQRAADLRTSKRRPALVVQADGMNTDVPQVIVANIPFPPNLPRQDKISR